MTRRRIEVPVEPLPEASWERVERKLGAARAVELEAQASVDLLRWSRRLVYATILVTGVAAGMLALSFRRVGGPAGEGRPAAAAAAAVPTRVATGPGDRARLDLGDAQVELGEKTTLVVHEGEDDAVSLELVRGTVDCEVPPRAGRPPFQVVAADVAVTVVGTRFSVERFDTVRVRVARGQVRVASPRGVAQVAAGQAWEPARGVVAAAAAGEPPSPGAPGASAAAGSGAATSPATQPSALGPVPATLAEAEALERGDPDRAAAGYRALSRGADAAAEPALWRLARLEFERGRFDAAVAAVAQYEARFPRGARLEELLWLRVEAHCALWRSQAAADAARVYLGRFPDGPRAAAARAPAVCEAAGR